MTTNFEKIKNMSIEEMVEFLDDTDLNGCQVCKKPIITECGGCNCRKGIKQWLESECDNEQKQ